MPLTESRFELSLGGVYTTAIGAWALTTSVFSLLADNTPLVGDTAPFKPHMTGTPLTLTGLVLAVMGYWAHRERKRKLRLYPSGDRRQPCLLHFCVMLPIYLPVQIRFWRPGYFEGPSSALFPASDRTPVTWVMLFIVTSLGAFMMYCGIGIIAETTGFAPDNRSARLVDRIANSGTEHTAFFKHIDMSLFLQTTNSTAYLIGSAMTYGSVITFFQNAASAYAYFALVGCACALCFLFTSRAERSDPIALL